ncbi:MAG: T9SS type A sorting domain-containing protein [Ignavibacteria bacterium]|nr:T9SS type A sorting domain-containing protein [Ignavibacteria bacterium]
MKKLITFLMVLVCFVLLGKTADAQTSVFSDDFSTNQSATYTTSGAIGSSAWSINRSGVDFGGRRNTSPAQLELTNDASGSGNVNGWAFGNTSMSSFTSPYNTTLSSNVGVVTWNFNMRQIRTDPAGFGSGSYGAAYILAGSSATAFNAGNGYAVVLGQSGSTDPVRLAHYTTGLSGTLTSIITSNTSGLTDFGAEYLSVRVTYTPSTNTWELFLRNDGGSAFTDPTTGTLVSQGTVVNSTHTGSSLTFMGGYWSGSTGATQTAFFDNASVTVTEPAPTTQASNITFANVGDNQMDVNWTNGNGANRVVIVNTSSSFTTPTDGTSPSADASWNNAGEQVVYNGSSNTVTVTGLTAGTTYHYKVFEYSGTGSVTRFNGNTNTNNPNSQATTGGGGLTPPDLTAAVGATVDGAFIVTFVDDAAWRADILGIEIGGVELTAGYNITAGQITFTPSASTPANLLQQSGSKNIVVIAASYNDAPVTQVISPGAATNLGISVQPTAPASNGAVLAQQPVILIRDQYNNTTTSTANVTASVGSGTWTIGGTTTQAGVSGTATFTNLTASSDNAVTGATINFASTGLTGATSGTFNIPSPPTSGLQLSAEGTSYTIDFEGTLTNVSNGAFTGSGFQLTPSAGQLSSSTFAITGFSDGDLAFDGTRTTGDYSVGSTTGGASTGGGVYAFTGTPTSTGLGFQPTTADWTPGTLSMRVQNKTGVTATTLLVSYKVHVYNDGDRSSSFNFSYSGDDASYTPVSEMNLTTPQALDGSPSWRTYIRIYTINLSLANNGLYYFRWSSDDVGGSGNRDEIVIDDINVIVNPTSAQYPSFSGSCQDLSGYGNFGLSGSLTVSGTATIASGTTATLGTNNFTGTGGSATLAGTGTIALSGDLNTQIASYNSNTFATTGRYLFYGNSQVIPAGTYEDLRVQGTGTTLSGDLTVNGDLEMQGTLTVGANTLTISNPITVNPTNLTMDATSSLVINGTAANIHVPSSVTALNNFTYNNSSLVTADANLTISGTFTLGTSGFILDMGANTLEIGTSTASIGAISRVGSGSVRGIIKRWTNTATSSLLFPLNNNATDYVGATVNFSVNPTTGGSLTARYTSTGSGLFPLGPNGIDRYIDFSAQHPGMNLINLSPQFWTISDADGLAGFTYGLSLEANNMGINTSGNNYQYTAIVKRNTGGGNTWAWSNSNHVTTGGSGSNPIPQCQGYTSFSDFAIGGNQDNLLPVELSNFTSAIAGRDLILSWSTGTETNNSGFDIERKSTTGNWSKIGNVAGHGTVNTPNSYTYTDRNLSSGKYNYRLKQIDFNGNYKYYELSNEVIIGTPSKYVLTQNFPNPFNPSTSISYEIPATNFVSLKIYDMMGKEVANLVNGTQEAGFYTVKFDASKLASGVYFYKLQANDFTATKKLMLMK